MVSFSLFFKVQETLGQLNLGVLSPEDRFLDQDQRDICLEYKDQGQWVLSHQDRFVVVGNAF